MKESALSRPKIVIIAGATASGKTDLGVTLAQQLNAEVVSADSIQIYDRLNIGSARPTPEELRGVPHHLFGIVPLRESFDAARFAVEADAVIHAIAARRRHVLIVGGAGLYVRALVRGLAAGIPSDPMVRATLNLRASQGIDEIARMHQELTVVDPAYAALISPRDPIRIVRALEVYEVSHEPLSLHHARHAAMPDRYESLLFCLDVSRQVLSARIEARTHEMFTRGWVDEVTGILADGYPRDLKPLQSVGYAQVVAHVLDAVPLEETLTRIAVETRAFAKRQRTWFRGEKSARWMEPDTMRSPEFVRELRTFLDR